MTVLVAGAVSDSHTWNLMYLQLFVEELGHRVVNLGPCVPPALLVDTCRAVAPDLIVISSVNGHGHPDGLRAVTHVRARLGSAAPPAVIGGKLGVDGPLTATELTGLRAAGFAAVFDGGDVERFRSFLTHLGSTAQATEAVDTMNIVDAVRVVR